MSTSSPLRRFVALAGALLLAATLVAVLPASRPAASTPADPLGPVFDPLPDFVLPPAGEARVRPQEYAAHEVDLAALRDVLATAPTPAEAQRGAPSSVVTVPDPDGRPVRFAVSQAPVMEPALAARHPELRTYRGRGVDDPALSVALDLTPLGFHAFVRRPGGHESWLVDPARNERGTTVHLSYLGEDSAEPELPFDFRPPLPRLGPGGDRDRAAARPGPGQPVPLRTYRLALVTDPSYAAYFGTENVLAEKVTLMNRVNRIYSDDLAIDMILVDGTERLNLDTAAKATGADGPCGASACYTPTQLAGCSSGLLTRNQFVLGQLVGADAYDIGHIALGLNGGGIAGLGVVGEERKAAGCTGLPRPQGDFFAIDYVAHEMGHQFNGNHTFDGSQGNCSLTNRNPGTSVEPGSGSSVMAYAGICAQDDLQPHTDPYFSQRSLDEVDEHVTAEPFDYGEEQTVTLTGFDADGDAVRLRYEGRELVLERGLATYNPVVVQQGLVALTGAPVTVSGYDGGLTADDDGFTVTWPDTADHPRIAATAVEDAGGDPLAVAVGVQVQGGPGTNQGAVTASGNRAPRVTAPADRTIPVRTPFTLTGSGSDVDGDPLVYLWEQDDEGAGQAEGTALTDNQKRSGPLFRVFGTAAEVSDEAALESPSPGQNQAGRSPSRTFPDMAQVLAGNTNAATGACAPAPADPDAPVPAAVVECFSEFLPTADYTGDPLLGGGRELNFRLTARDQRDGGGGTAFDDVRLTLATDAGPFLLTSLGERGATRRAGATETLRWEVNGTDAPGLAPEVRITVSADGGRTFPHVAAARTANDGSAPVTWPQVTSDRVRVRVEAVGNYFFDVNDADLAVVDTRAPQTRVVDGPGTGALLATPRVAFGLAADERPVTYACRLDGRAVACGSARAVLPGLGAGQHRFTVAARDAAGNLDPTPAVRRFAVARDDRQLRRSGPWRPQADGDAFRGTLLRAARRGATVALDVSRVRRVGVVVATSPGGGPLVVRVGSRVLGRVSTAGPARDRVVRALPTLRRPVSGRLTVRTTSGRVVRLDGVAVFRG